MVFKILYKRVCSGFTPKEILQATDNEHITLQRIQNIKAKRSFKELTACFEF